MGGGYGSKTVCTIGDPLPSEAPQNGMGGGLIKYHSYNANRSRVYTALETPYLVCPHIYSGMIILGGVASSSTVCLQCYLR